MGWIDIPKQRGELRRELQQLDEHDALAERERVSRQRRRAEILTRLGWMDAVEDMMSKLAEPGTMLTPPTPRLATASSKRAAYGSVRSTIHSVMETRPDAWWKPPEIEKEAKVTFDVELRLASVRSYLKRMAEEGKFARDGDRYQLRKVQSSPLSLLHQEPGDAA